MGVVNTTPDSFSDGGRYLAPDAAIEKVDRLAAAGSDFIDIGGESTRPGAAAVPADEQLRRIEPALRHAVDHTDCAVSVDTTLAAVAEQALEWGADVINDISCLSEPSLASAAAKHGAALVIMHSRGAMSGMKGYSTWPDDDYQDIVRDVLRDWMPARERAVDLGVASDEIYFDPGLGFAKNARQSMEVVARLDEFASAGAPLLVGPSRKSFIGAVDGSEPGDRLGGTIAACLECVKRGAAVLRVHDVQPVRQAILLARALREQAESSTRAVN
jgi:dihydropteroate synthase